MAAPHPQLAEAIAAHQSGDLAKAERLYRAFLQTEPEHADGNALLGVALASRGEFGEGIALVNKAVAIDPASGLLHFHRGTVLMAAQHYGEAVAALTRAVELQPQTAQVRFNLANALRANDEWVGAIAQYNEALRLDQEYLAAYNNLALSLVHEKKYEEARDAARQALAIDADYGDGWLTLCNVAEKLGDYDEAFVAGKRAIELKPDDHYSWFGYGIALNKLNRDAEAVEAYRRALALNPARADILDNLAQSYQALNRLEEAEATFRKAVEVAGEIIVGEDTRDVNESEYGKRHWHLALIELLRGDYKRGFARYRARGAAIAQLKRLKMPCPLWKGEDLAGKTLLVCDEQGYGDTLMLARFLPLLRARGARIVFSVHKVLAPLFQGWDGADKVIAHEEPVPTADYFCSSFDLPHRCGATLEGLPNAVPYLPVLTPDAATLSPTGGFKIGVVWGGSPLHLADRKRSVPLSVFAGLFAVPGAKFYCFNRDLKPGDSEVLPHYRIENLIPRLTNFADAARLIGQMDLVITCDTATAHLAGGLGKKVWIMLPFSPDWRWLTGRSDSPWYPTARLFRQPKPDDWASVADAVKRELIRTLDRS